MSGTDNLPERLRELLPDESDWYGFALVEEAADEIERLEQWKTEATKALTHWHHVAEPVVAGNAKYLGWFKWDAVAVELNRQDTEIERLRELVADAKTIITMTDFTSSTMDDLEHLWLKKEKEES